MTGRGHRARRSAKQNVVKWVVVDRRAHPQARTWSLLLASLALTTDDDLKSFRDRRSLDSTLDLGKLRQARGLLDAIAQTIQSDDPSRWERLGRAFDLLAADAEIIETVDTTAVSPVANAEAPPPPASVPPSDPAPAPPPPARPPQPQAARLE
jgi:hypothetical protein